MLQHSHIQPQIEFLANKKQQNIGDTVIKKWPGGALNQRFDLNYRKETVGSVCLIINSICVNIGDAHQVDRGSQEKRKRDGEKKGGVCGGVGRGQPSFCLLHTVYGTQVSLHF